MIVYRSTDTEKGILWNFGQKCIKERTVLFYFVTTNTERCCRKKNKMKENVVSGCAGSLLNVMDMGVHYLVYLFICWCCYCLFMDVIMCELS